LRGESRVHSGSGEYDIATKKVSDVLPMADMKPKISILTPSYRQGRYIEQNILSVLAQGYPQTEHIVVDGGSKDETVEILKKYPHLTWISEKDGGQADALAKALTMSTGEIIGWINSDDYYLPHCFENVLKAFGAPNVNWIVGNIVTAYEAIGAEVRLSSPAITYEKLIADPDILKQQATFFRRSFLEEAGGFDRDFHMVMDYDLWLRLSKRSAPRMINEYWAVFRMQTEQKTSGGNQLAQLAEILRIYSRERVPTSRRARLASRKLLYYCKYRLKRLLIKCGVVGREYAEVPLSLRNVKGTH
jgi:glycosyltransferase involved in cell wall biosynthesis